MTIGNSLIRERIQLDINGSADWRKSVAQKFPLDKRNQRAAERLAEFAYSDEEPESETLSKISCHRRFKHLRPAVSAACRDVGFRFEPRSLDDMFIYILEKMDDDSNGSKK